jgi:hypothetical protein
MGFDHDQIKRVKQAIIDSPSLKNNTGNAYYLFFAAETAAQDRSSEANVLLAVTNA